MKVVLDKLTASSPRQQLIGFPALGKFNSSYPSREVEISIWSLHPIVGGSRKRFIGGDAFIRYDTGR
ncbi:MAG: hypothetical protein DMG85_06680 [Acidobacteria bacterium]|nr:MAG: hypothetical protein DMG85_06680 [Acidobacteriota bacterium]